MPRPTINEDIVSEIRLIHRRTQGQSAGSFQEALDTVLQLAWKELDEDREVDKRTEGWYPGKYAGIVIDNVLDDLSRKQDSPPTQPTEKPTSSPDTTRHTTHHSPENSAMFKTHFNENREITIPAAEADALGFEPGDILQIIAYSVENKDRV